MSQTAVVDAFLSQLRGPLRDAFARWTGLPESLTQLLAHAQSEHGKFGPPETEFAAYLARRLPDSLAADPSLAALRAGDLYVAFGCAVGDPRALRIFDEQFLPPIRQAVTQRGADAVDVDEVAQRVRSRILVSTPPSRPRIEEYKGRGPLAGWVVAVAVRSFLDLRRAHPAEEATPSDELPEVASQDPELVFIKERYRGEFKKAFEAALQALSPKDRNVLRLKTLDGLSIDEIGRIYGAHRATAARWVSTIRENLAAETRARLARALNLDTGELEGLMRLLISNLEVSISTILRSEPEVESEAG